MMRGFSTLTKTVSLATLMIFVGCSSDSNRIASPDPDSGSQVPVLSAPLGPSHLVTTGGDFLRWNEPANAADVTIAGYNLYVFDPQPDAEQSYVRWNSSLITSSNITVTTFNPSSTYWFRVAAVSDGDVEGEMSSPQSFVAVGPGNRGNLHDLPTTPVEPQGGDDPYQP